MLTSNIDLGKDVFVDVSSSINNVKIGSKSKIARNCSIFGSKEHQLIMGCNCYVGMNTVINGYNSVVIIGDFVSIAQNVSIMSDSGPNMSDILQSKFPIEMKPITIGNHCWIGAGATILPGTVLEDFCVVGANSVVRGHFKEGSVIAGAMAKVIRVEKYDI